MTRNMPPALSRRAVTIWTEFFPASSHPLPSQGMSATRHSWVCRHCLFPGYKLIWSWIRIETIALEVDRGPSSRLLSISGPIPPYHLLLCSSVQYQNQECPPRPPLSAATRELRSDMD